MEKKRKRMLTRDKIIGMQVINSEGYFIGKIKELSLVVGESDQALVIDDGNGNENEVRWSDVSSAGDVILLKSKEENIMEVNKSVQSSRCPSCNSELEKNAIFCTGCGRSIVR